MKVAIEVEQETDSRWIAEIDEFDGVLVYGVTKEEAITKVKKLADRVLSDRELNHGFTGSPTATDS